MSRENPTRDEIISAEMARSIAELATNLMHKETAKIPDTNNRVAAYMTIVSIIVRQSIIWYAPDEEGARQALLTLCESAARSLKSYYELLDAEVEDANVH